MQNLDPEYRLVSGASSAKYSQPAEQLGYMAIVSQPDCYWAILNYLCPSAPPVEPAMKTDAYRPHIF